MKTIGKALLVISGIALILVALSMKIFPDWLTIPGGVLVLLGIAFNAVLNAGSKIKSWIDLIEKNNTISKENELKQNLDLKRRIEEDFGDWLNYFPKNRKRNSKMMLRAHDGNQYPDSNEPDKLGEYSWFAAEIYTLYHNGIEFICGIEKLALYENNLWDFIENAKGDYLETIKVFKIGQVRFSDIVEYDLKGDEFYPFPHFFCKFRYKGLPFEQIYFRSADDKTSYLHFELKDRKS